MISIQQCLHLVRGELSEAQYRCIGEAYLPPDKNLESVPSVTMNGSPQKWSRQARNPASSRAELRVNHRTRRAPPADARDQNRRASSGNQFHSSLRRRHALASHRSLASGSFHIATPREGGLLKGFRDSVGT
jgi:hypothetical protein